MSEVDSGNNSKISPDDFKDDDFLRFDLVAFFQSEEWEQSWGKQSDIPVVDWQSGFYPNLEQWLRIQPPAVGNQVLVVARFTDHEPLAQQLQRLYLLLQALEKYTSKITLFLPYMPYSLQDRETQPGVSVASELLVKQLEATGIDAVVLLDVHSQSNLDAWSIPVEHLLPTKLLATHIRKALPTSELTVVAPDKGARQRAQELAQELGCAVVTLQKRRLGPGKVSIAPVDGEELRTNQLIIVDDILNTGGTLVNAISQLQSANPDVKISVAITHGLFANGAEGKLQRSGVDKIITTNSFAASVDQSRENLVCANIFPNLLLS